MPRTRTADETQPINAIPVGPARAPSQFIVSNGDITKGNGFPGGLTIITIGGPPGANQRSIELSIGIEVVGVGLDHQWAGRNDLDALEGGQEGVQVSSSISS